MITSITKSQNVIEYCKDNMTEKEYVFFKEDLLCSKDKVKGFIIRVMLTYGDGKAKYSGIYVLSVGVGSSCVENSTLDLLYDDESKVSLLSWNDFNCDGESNFDLGPNKFDLLSKKKIKAIRFTNGRTYDQYTYNLKMNGDYFIFLKELISKNKLIKVTCED